MNTRACTTKKNYFIIKLFAVASVGLIPGCTTQQPRPADYCAPFPPDILGGLDEGLRKDAAKYGPYAVLSNNVYDPNDHLDIWVNPNEWEPVCDADHKIRDSYGNPSCVADGSRNGFQAKTYLRRAGDNSHQPIELVFVFRGTDQKRDWFLGNFYFSEAQYIEADDYVRPKIAKYLDMYPQINVTATGHSLGGGLAEHVAFCFDGVTAVTFNPSSISHKNSCDRLTAISKDERTKIKGEIRGQKIHRISQTGEVLESTRKVYDSAIAYNFKAPGSAHSITPLAMNLTQLAGCSMQRGLTDSLAPGLPSAEKVLTETCTRWEAKSPCVM